MWHHKAHRKLGRKLKLRRALIRSLLHNLILNERMRTSEARAKEIRPRIEKLITTARQPTVARRRSVAALLGGDAEATKKLFAVIAPKYQSRPGGYTRILKVGRRLSDGRPEVIISFV